MAPARILVTGASSGIGRACAIRLAAEGHQLILHGRNLARLEETRSMCAEMRHFVWIHDLLDVEGIEASLVPILNETGNGLTGIAHCAGFSMIRPLRLVQPQDALSQFKVNCLSAFEVSRVANLKKCCYDSLKSIVFVGSIANRQPARGFSVYAASKSALEGMTTSMAVELAPRVRVNIVLPGPVSTPGTANLDALGQPTISPPLGPGTAESIARSISFLMSENASWITGQSLVVDGGCSLA